MELSLPTPLVHAGLALRPETGADRAFLVALFAEQRSEEVAATPWSAVERVRFLADQFRLQEAHYAAHHADAERRIVTRDGAPIGRLYVRRHPRWWRLLEIGLSADARGDGIGTALVGLVVAAAAAARAGVELQVTPDNTRAIAFYRGLGFAQAPPHGAGRLRLRRPR